jgi:ABC-type Fe3+/spermidine/putrescine transport system ATPase subunit
MLRPEYIHLGTAGTAIPDAENCYQARILDITYLGDSLALTVRIGDRIDLMAAAKATTRNQALSLGQAITVGFSAADLHVFEP